MRGKILLSLAAMAGATVLAAPSNAGACGGTFVLLSRGELQWDDLNDPFYAATEGSPLQLAIERSGHPCPGTPNAEVDWSSQPGSAGTGDFTQTQGHVSLAPPTSGTTYAFRSIATTDDSAEESAEAFTVQIDEVDNASFGLRRSVPAYIIDDDGAGGWVFAPGSRSQSESVSQGQIAVFRTGATTGPVDYEIRPGSAELSKDFSATSLTGTLSFTDADRVDTINFRVINDSLKEMTENFQIALIDDGGADIETLEFSILDNEEGVAPISRWHHPKHGLTYRYENGRLDYRLREIHIFTSDNMSGVQKAQFALRRKLKNGSCRWWTGDGFAKGACSTKRWVRTRSYEPDFFFARLPNLTPSVGTTVVNYRAYSRAIDKAGNVESRFTVGRNANTFEVRR